MLPNGVVRRCSGLSPAASIRPPEAGVAAHTGAMISVSTARRLRDAGLTWTPDRGDRFIVADRDMDDEVFVLSDMTVDVHRRPEGTRLGFNGTTEWALDSVAQEDALWLPREDQLRDLLRGTFRRLDRTVAPDGMVRYTVTSWPTGDETQGGSAYESDDPAEAYGLALLALIRLSAEAG